MDKLKMHTVNKADDNFKNLAEKFPNAVTETIDENGEVVRAIDKDVLMQEISTKVVDGNEERYQFTWPDKKKSVLLANTPIAKPLRPCREESVDFDSTENLYIEGDNLDVLKLLQETYLGKATMIVEHISYDQLEGEYDSTIFTAEKSSQGFDKAFRANKAIQDYVFTDGTAEQSIERRFVQDLDAADEVCVYAKLPKGFHIPTPVGNYSPDWAIAFYEGMVKHIFFIAETKGTMDSLNLRPIEQAKISCAKKLFNEISTSEVRYHDVNSYQALLNIMESPDLVPFKSTKKIITYYEPEPTLSMAAEDFEPYGNGK